MNIVLTAHSTYQLLRVISAGMKYCLGHLVHQCLHNLITRQFHVEHRFATVYLLHRHITAMLVGLSLPITDMLNKRPLEYSFEDKFLIVDEGLYTLVLQLTDGTSAHIYNHLILIGHTLVYDSLTYVVLRLFIEKG